MPLPQSNAIIPTPNYKPINSTQTSEQWTWSNKLKGDYISISGDGKSINIAKPGKQGGVMVDVPMSEGKFSWKIKISQPSAAANYRIGVAQQHLDLDFSFITECFWGFNPSYAYKLEKG